MSSMRAWAVVIKGTDDVPFTNAPYTINGGDLYQVYVKEEDAKRFCRIRFAGTKYAVRPCRIILDK